MAVLTTSQTELSPQRSIWQIIIAALLLLNGLRFFPTIIARFAVTITGLASVGSGAQVLTGIFWSFSALIVPMIDIISALGVYKLRRWAIYLQLLSIIIAGIGLVPYIRTSINSGFWIVPGLIPLIIKIIIFSILIISFKKFR